MMKIPAARIASVAMMNAPSLAALDIYAPYESRLKNSATNSSSLLLKLLERAFDHGIPFVQQDDSVRNSLRALQDRA